MTKENRFVARVLRGLFALRKRLDTPTLKRLVAGFYTHSAKERDTLASFIPPEEVRRNLLCLVSPS